MKKYIILALILSTMNTFGYCSENAIEEKKPQQKENTSKEIHNNTGAAAPVENFEFKPCKGDEKIKGCKIEDIIEKEESKSNKLP